MKTYGGWRSYTPGYLVSDDAEITREILDQMLSIMGFASLEAFRDEVGQYARGEFSSDLLQKLRRLLQSPGDSPTPDLFWIPNELRLSIYNPSTKDTDHFRLQNPFILAKNPSDYSVDIQEFSISEDAEGSYILSFRAGISCEKLYQSRSSELAPICDLIALGNLAEALDPSSSSSLLFHHIEKWILDYSDYRGSISSSLLDEIDFQCRMLNELFGIGFSGIANDDGEEIVFFVDSSEEEKGFL